ncbi:MAG TPA: TrmH family RNA methyltransferase, partial [Bryobacteraceae bacterium]|nr:TrmH family RNA methyltransferase [Bryobacteraceae bacterium]
TDFVRRCAIIVGSEGRGISKELYGLGEDVAIPTSGVESLNAAVATSVLLYEASRQRRDAVRAEARREHAV